MKKILFSVVASFMMLGVGSASAQTDADNFYKSNFHKSNFYKKQPFYGLTIKRLSYTIY